MFIAVTIFKILTIIYKIVIDARLFHVVHILNHEFQFQTLFNYHLTELTGAHQCAGKLKHIGWDIMHFFIIL